MRNIFLALAISGSIFADSNCNLIYDPHFSPYAGADDLITLHQILENSKLDQLTQLYRLSPRPVAKFTRAAELFFFWDPMNYFGVVTQHEVFGHGYRVRSLDVPGTKVLDYRIGTPPPYGDGGGLTSYWWFPEKTAVFEKLTIVTGGVEATSILANRVRLQWVKTGFVNPRQSSLYLWSAHDITNYILRSKSKSEGDITKYLSTLNYTYINGNLPLKSLKDQTLVNFLDPFTYFSLYSWGHYVATGLPSPLPMFSIGPYDYLPSARLGFTPFGPEYYAENFLVKDNKPIYIYARGGKFANHSYTGLGIEYQELFQLASIPIGFRLDVWRQPNIDFRDPKYFCTNYPRLNRQDSRFGFSASLIAERKLWDNGAFFLQCGWKSQGYVPGEPLTESPIFRVGITLW